MVGWHKGRLGLLVGLAVGLLCWGCAMGPQSATGEETTDFPSPGSPTGGQVLPIEAQAIVGDRTIYLEVARTPTQQQIGLMFRESLGPACGMLFPFEPPRTVGFWMKNVPISLDMVFLRENIVRAIAADVPPCKEEPCPLYGPQVPVDAVVELAGGRAAELGLVVGTRLEVQPLAAEAAIPPPCP